MEKAHGRAAPHGISEWGWSNKLFFCQNPNIQISRFSDIHMSRFRPLIECLLNPTRLRIFSNCSEAIHETMPHRNELIHLGTSLLIATHLGDVVAANALLVTDSNLTPALPCGPDVDTYPELPKTPCVVRKDDLMESMHIHGCTQFESHKLDFSETKPEDS